MSGFHGTPFRESSFDSEYAEQHLVDALATQVDEQTIKQIIKVQKESLSRFEKTNEMLVSISQLSEKRLEKAKRDAAAHKETIIQMKADLDFIFKKIRIFKANLSNKHPDTYGQVVEELKSREPAEDAEDAEEQ